MEASLFRGFVVSLFGSLTVWWHGAFVVSLVGGMGIWYGMEVSLFRCFVVMWYRCFVLFRCLVVWWYGGIVASCFRGFVVPLFGSMVVSLFRGFVVSLFWKFGSMVVS